MGVMRKFFIIFILSLNSPAFAADFEVLPQGKNYVAITLKGKILDGDF